MYGSVDRMPTVNLLVMGVRTQLDRTAESRRRLLDAARTVLAERGYTGTTLAAIGQEADLSRGLITHHFGTKEHIIAAVIEHVRREFAHGMSVDGRPRGLRALDRLMEFYLITEPERLMLSRAVYSVMIEACTSAPGLRETVARHDETVRNSIVAYIREAAEAGEIPVVPEDADTLAVMINAMLRGAVLQWLVAPDAVDRDAYACRMKKTVRAMLAAS
jgi:AcrR family transcriptional regulator